MLLFFIGFAESFGLVAGLLSATIGGALVINYLMARKESK